MLRSSTTGVSHQIASAQPSSPAASKDLLTFTEILAFDPGELRSAEPQQLR